MYSGEPASAATACLVLSVLQLANNASKPFSLFLWYNVCTTSRKRAFSCSEELINNLPNVCSCSLISFSLGLLAAYLIICLKYLLIALFIWGSGVFSNVASFGKQPEAINLSINECFSCVLLCFLKPSIVHPVETAIK